MDPVHEYLLPPSATLEEKKLGQISKNCIFRSFALTFFPHWREMGAKEIWIALLCSVQWHWNQHGFNYFHICYTLDANSPRLQLSTVEIISKNVIFRGWGATNLCTDIGTLFFFFKVMETWSSSIGLDDHAVRNPDFFVLSHQINHQFLW